MAQAAKSQEPSMEEILASIRRIIAEDDSDKPAQRPAEAAGVDIASDEIGSSLAAPRSLREPAPQEASAPSDSPSSDISKMNRAATILGLAETTSPLPRSAGFDPAPAPTAAPGDARSIDDAAPASETSVAHDDERGRLVSSATSAAVDSAFNALAQTVLVHNARTLEDLVREMLRPMLKVWLDDNLPGMVERLVRAEIERVSRGR
jgi:cell pole-organizing protein PopZ